MVPVTVVLLVPMLVATSADVDGLADDAKQLVRCGKLSLDGIKIKHRLPK